MSTPADPLIRSEIDEALMLRTLQKCYSSEARAFRVSSEHYRYLAEQVVALRVHCKRDAPPIVLTREQARILLGAMRQLAQSRQEEDPECVDALIQEALYDCSEHGSDGQRIWDALEGKC